MKQFIRSKGKVIYYKPKQSTPCQTVKEQTQKLINYIYISELSHINYRRLFVGC